MRHLVNTIFTGDLNVVAAEPVGRPGPTVEIRLVVELEILAGALTVPSVFFEVDQMLEIPTAPGLDVEPEGFAGDLFDFV